MSSTENSSFLLIFPHSRLSQPCFFNFSEKIFPKSQVPLPTFHSVFLLASTSFLHIIQKISSYRKYHNIIPLPFHFPPSFIYTILSSFISGPAAVSFFLSDGPFTPLLACLDSPNSPAWVLQIHICLVPNLLASLTHSTK